MQPFICSTAASVPGANGAELTIAAAGLTCGLSPTDCVLHAETQTPTSVPYAACTADVVIRRG